MYEHQPVGRPKGQIVFLHGLEGSSEAVYIRSMSQAALTQGFGVHRTNMRTCGGTEGLSETMYHSGLTADTKFIVNRIRERDLGPVFIVGFSLGGNVTLKLASEVEEQGPVAGVCAVSTPIDLASCVRELNRRESRYYGERFLRRLKDRIRRKSVIHPELYSTDGLDEVSTIWEFDDRFTAPLFGFGDAANYYATQSAQRYLSDIRIPTLAVQAKDDPLIPFQVYDHPAFAENPALELLAVEHGGHLGFISREKPRFWLDGVVLAWISRQLEERSGFEGTNTESFASA